MPSYDSEGLLALNSSISSQFKILGPSCILTMHVTVVYLAGEFLRASAMLKHVIDNRLDVCPSVRLSVCLSVTRWYCIKTAKHIVMLSSPHDSLFILVVCIKIFAKFQRGHPLRGR